MAMARVIPKYIIRPMLREEIPEVLDLWRETNLSEGTYSLNTWYEHDPDGFYVAVDEEGTVIGSCAGVFQNDNLAFIGLYVVKSIYQRRGIGRKIWNAVMERVGDRNAGVNPVPEQLENYRDKAGFFFQSSWSSVVCVTKDFDPSQMCSDVPGVKIRPLTTDDKSTISHVIDYDETIVGFSRKKLVPLTCDQKESVSMVAIRKENNEICGYGNIKKNIRGNALIGPLYADDVKIAEALLSEMMKAFPLSISCGVELVTINCNRKAIAMAEKLGFKILPGIARLYRKEEVIVKFEKVFGQHNLNFSVF